jgi:hypothetical protein
VGREQRALDVRWERPVAERAVALYAEGQVAQMRLRDPAQRERVRRRVHRAMAAQMERQFASRGAYVPFDPIRMVVARKAEGPGPNCGSACRSDVPGMRP